LPLLGNYVALTIGDITQKRHKPYPKIKDDVEVHFGCDISWQPSLNLLARSEHHDGHKGVNHITNTADLSVSIN
jgi:hypothetical protein